MNLIINLMYLFCALNLSSGQYFAKSSQGYSLLPVTEASVSEFNEEFQTTTSDRKSKVKKRPGVSVYPVLTTDLGDKYDKDLIKVEEEDLSQKYSSSVPRKSAGDPPSLNDTNFLLNSNHSTNISTDNLDKNDDEMIHHTDQDDLKVDNKSLITNNTGSVTVNKTYVDLTMQHKNGSDSIDKNKNNSILIVPTNDTSFINTSTSLNPDLSKLHTVSSNFENSTSFSIAPSLNNDSEKTTFTSRKPSIASAKDSTNTSSSTTIIAAIVIIVLVCSLVGYITYKRLYAYWNRRHYSRVDFLIDGLYEM